MGRPKGSKNKDYPLEAAKELTGYIPSQETPPVIVIEVPLIDRWITDGIPCKYVRFCQVPVPAAQGKEPVWEFKLEAKTKYSVDAMCMTEGGLVFIAYGEQCVVELGNIGYWRPL